MNLFKIQLIFLLINVFTLDNAIGQKFEKYKQGYLVLESNDTIKGKILYLSESVKYEEIGVLKRGTEEQVSINEIKKIKYKDGLSYEKKEVNGKIYLAKNILKGGVSLYKTVPGKDRTYLIEKENNTLFLSGKKSNKNQSNNNQQNVTNEQIREVRFSQAQIDTSLVKVYDDCSDLILSKYKLSQGFLKKHVEKINTCLGTNVKTFPTRRLIHQFSLLGGRTITNRETFNIDLCLSLKYNLYFSNTSRKLSLFARLNYLESEFKRDLSVFVVGCSYKFSIKKIQPYFSIGTGLARGNSTLSGGNDPFGKRTGAFPYELGIGVEVPISYRLSIVLDSSLSTIFTSVIGVAYNIRSTK